MKTLTYSKLHDLGGLHDELIAAVPSLRPVDGPDGFKVAVMTVLGVGDVITLEVPSASNTSAIDEVVAAHDPAPYVAARAAKKANESTVSSNVRNALTQLRQARTVLNGTPSNAQILQAVRMHNDVLLALVKLEARDFEADD